MLRHVELVGEAGEALLKKAAELGVPLDADLIRVGIAIHDAGKITVSSELDVPGAEHEPAGQQLLLAHGVSPEVARICLTHAQWASMPVRLEELVVALADKLWKGVRNPALEERVIDGMATALGEDRWSLFVELDNLFEEIAAGGSARLERSRV